MDRIYPKFSKKKFDKEFDLLCKEYKNNNPNFGLIEHPPKLTLIQKIKLWTENQILKKHILK